MFMHDVQVVLMSILYIFRLGHLATVAFPSDIIR